MWTTLNQMIQKKLKSTGETVFILGPLDKAPEMGIWFRWDEWEHAQTIGQSTHDPEDQKSFWLGLMEKKRASPSYCIFEDFPRHNGENAILKICRDIIEGLKFGERPKSGVEANEISKRED